MKKIVITLFLILGSLTIQAQELTWQTNINKAMEISKKSKKPLFLFFTGSDWCGWCIRLQKEVFKTPEFEKWAKDKEVPFIQDESNNSVEYSRNRIRHNILPEALLVSPGLKTIVKKMIVDINKL